MQGLNYLSCNCHGGDEDSLYPKGREEGLQVAREPEWHGLTALQHSPADVATVSSIELFDTTGEGCSIWLRLMYGGIGTAVCGSCAKQAAVLTRKMALQQYTKRDVHSINLMQPAKIEVQDMLCGPLQRCVDQSFNKPRVWVPKQLDANSD